MSGPQDMQGIAKMLGMPGGPAGPRPTMPLGQSTKRMGDSQVPMSGQRPQRHPGQVQDQAARKLGVPNYQVRPTGKPPQQAQAPQQPPQPQVQAPPPPSLPTPMPRSRPSDAPLPPEMNPNPMAEGRTPMPMGRPSGAGPGRPDPGVMSKVAQVLGDFLTAQPPPGSPSTFPNFGLGSGKNDVPKDVASGPKSPSAFPSFGLGSDKPPSSFGNSAYEMIAGLLGGGGKPSEPNKPGLSSAIAAPSPPKPDPFSGGASPIQAGPEQLIPALVAQAKAKAEQSRPPVQAPEATRPSPNVTPPVPPGQPIPPPPSMQPRPQEYTPSQPSFKGYEVRPPKAEKGEEKHKEKALKKGNNLYYYTRVGVTPGDNSGVYQALREAREKVKDPKLVKTMTPEEDRILAQYADSHIKGGDPSLLMSMEPADVARRFEEYRGGRGKNQIPDRYQERAPGAESDSGPPALRLPSPKKKDPAEAKAADAIQNPKNRNDTDPDKKISVEDD